MTQQVGFDFDDSPPPRETRAQRWARLYDDGTYPTDFWEWLEDNYHIVEAFTMIALETKNANVARWSSDAICHVLRWQTAIRERGQNLVKINDHCTAGLARLVMNIEPALKGFFVTRTPPAKDQARRLINGKRYTEL